MNKQGQLPTSMTGIRLWRQQYVRKYINEGKSLRIVLSIFHQSLHDEIETYYQFCLDDGHSEKVQGSQKQVHYDYKNLLGGMMRKFSLVLLVFVGAGEEVIKEEEKSKVQAVEEDMGLKEQTTWDKDGSKMVLIPAGSFPMGDHLAKMLCQMHDI